MADVESTAGDELVPLRTMFAVFARDAVAVTKEGHYTPLVGFESYIAMLALPQDSLCELVLMTIGALRHPVDETGKALGRPYAYQSRMVALLVHLLKRKLPFRLQQLQAIAVEFQAMSKHFYDNPESHFVANVKRYVKDHPDLTEAELAPFVTLRDTWSAKSERDLTTCSKRLTEVLGTVLQEAPPIRLFRNGEVCAATMLDALEAMPKTERDTWAHLLAHAANCSTGSPAAGWQKAARTHITAVGEGAFVARLTEWLRLIDVPCPEVREERHGHHSYPIDPRSLSDPHLDALKGLAWMAGLVDDKELTRALGFAGISAYKKIPGVGPRATKVGNACVWALGNIGSDTALANLALMKVKVKFGTAQKSIEKALAKLAETLGVTPEELEEMSVPSYGLTEIGRLEEPMGDFTVVLEFEGDKPVARYLKADGTPQKSVPAALKADFKEDLKDLTGRGKDMQKMLSAQKERLDNLFLSRKVWPLEVWRERYLDHPLVGILARRLIWTLHLPAPDGAAEVPSTTATTTTAIWYGGALVTHDGPLPEPPADATVSLWHPCESDTGTIVRWRNWLFEHLVQQPFKQAHREIYLLTDAERNTAVYSNRFASHVLKQHQFNSLCAVRGWKNRLRLMVDDDYPPATKLLPAWGLRAEYWIEGMGDDYNEEYVLESGAFRYLTTDQVRFHRIDDDQMHAHAGGGGYGHGYGTNRRVLAPVALTDIPPIVLSEVLRDVDLFVGVCSVANDPSWEDGGPDGRHVEYWQSYSFGELGQGAEGRRDILTALLPRLKIAKQCRLDGKFLIVQGTVRTYKIHLGSGNILMEPNDQYLCIVQSSRGQKDTKVFLPFEGDAKLAVILSKAFLLAADDKIKDPTILSQLRLK